MFKRFNTLAWSGGEYRDFLMTSRCKCLKKKERKKERKKEIV